MTNFNVRNITLDDVPALIKLNEENIPEHYPVCVWQVHATVFNKVSFIALYQGKPVGYILCIFDKSDLRKPHALVTSFVVDKAFRRHGIGEALMTVCLDKAQKEYPDIRFISLNVRVSNTTAIQLYRKKGFKIIGTEKGYYGDGEDSFEMRRAIV